MYNIYFNSNTNDGINFDTFREKMIYICNEHRNSQKALVFALIIYDFESPHVSKILHDYDYWMALNSISGDKISIFSIHKPQRAEQSDILHRGMYNVYPNSEYNPSLFKEIAQKYFPIEIMSPSIVFFQVDREQVIDSMIIKIQKAPQEEAFEEIKHWLRIAIESISNVEEEYRNNYQEIFNLLLQDLERDKNSRIMISRITHITAIAPFIKEIIDFFSIKLH